MDKDVLSAFHANKPEPLAIIEPLDSAFALHTALLSCHTSPTVPCPPCQASIPEKAPYESAEELRVCIYHSLSRVSSGSSLQFALPRAFQYNCRWERCFRVRTIDRYILQELGVPLAQSLGALTFILMTREILRLIELLINKGVGLLPLLKTFLLLLPSFFVLTLPMACLIASISAFSRLSSDRELTALQASGISNNRLLRPLFIFAFAVFGVTLLLAQYAQPWSGPSVKKSALMMLRGEVSLTLDEGVFNTPTTNVVMYVGDTGLSGAGPGVFISDTRTKSEPRIIVAREWSLINDPLHNRIGMALRNGTIHVNPKDPTQYQIIRFSTYDFTMELGDSLAAMPEERPSIFEIRYWLYKSAG